MSQSGRKRQKKITNVDSEQTNKAKKLKKKFDDVSDDSSSSSRNIDIEKERARIQKRKKDSHNQPKSDVEDIPAVKASTRKKSKKPKKAKR